jgi:ABC-type multidrug transport system ATPase subunit
MSERFPGALELSRVTHNYGSVTALNSIDLALHRGEFCVLLGPNGAGKTTLLKILATLVRPTEGAMSWGGQFPERHQIGYVSHRSMLYEELTGFENLLFFAGLYGLDPATQRANQLCDEFGLSKSKGYKVAGYSRGMRQRLTLARALLHRPKILLLDEPFTGLDQHGYRTLTTVLKTLKSKQRTVMMATHNLKEGLELGSRILILDSGRLVYDVERKTISMSELEAAYFGNISQEVEGE